MEAWIRTLLCANGAKASLHPPQLFKLPVQPECKHVAASRSTGANDNVRAPSKKPSRVANLNM